jgi:hypothetical protein
VSDFKRNQYVIVAAGKAAQLFGSTIELALQTAGLVLSISPNIASQTEPA